MPPTQPIKLTLDPDTKRQLIKLTRALDRNARALEEQNRLNGSTAPTEVNDDANL